MVHPLSGIVQNDEKEAKRLNSLELKIVELENNLLRTSQAALEKRIAELEASLKESNEENDKLKQTIAHMNKAKKDVIPSKKEDSIEGLIDNDNDTDDINDDSISIIDKEEEIIYGRILKLIENMKSDCQRSINMKIPTESQLPKAPGSKLSASKSPSPTDGLISPSKMIGRSFTPSLIPSSISTSRVGTPTGAISPPNTSPNSQIPTKNTSLPSPSKTSHLPSRSNTPQSPPSLSNSINNVPVTSLNKKHHPRPRTGSWPANCSNIPSRPNSPQPAVHHHTGIPSNLPQKMQYRRQVTC